MKRVKFNKINILAVVISIILISSIITSYVLSLPSPGHGGDQIFISTNNGYLNFQQALSQGLLNGTISLINLGSSSPYLLGHNTSEILINLSGTEKNLQQAIESGSLCCGSCSGDSTYSTNLTFGHYANQILITNRSGQEKSIQKAIDEKDFCNQINSSLSQAFSGLAGDVFVTTGDEWSPQITDVNYTEVFYADTHGGGGGNYYSHAFLFFDTSLLPDNAQINTANLEFYGINYTTAYEIDPASTNYASFGILDYQKNIYNKTYLEIYYNTSNLFFPLDPNMFGCCWDWDKRYATFLSNQSLSSWKENAFNRINLSNPIFINKQGITSFVLMINPQTFYNEVNKGYASIFFYSQDSQFIDKRPKLIVNYTLS